MQDTPDTPDERFQRRRIRRWKRRGRILGPFLGVPLLLLTLWLSVDLVEYQPQEEPDRLADRPIRMTRPRTTQSTMRPGLSATTQANSRIPVAPEDAEGTNGDSIDLDVILPSAPGLRPPTPPYVVKRH
jgi:hypothetical protein